MENEEEEDSNYQRNLRDENEKYSRLKRKKKGNTPKQKVRKKRKLAPEVPRAMSGDAATRDRDDGNEPAGVSCYRSPTPASGVSPPEAGDGFFGATIEVPLNELTEQFGNFSHLPLDRWIDVCFPRNLSENKADIERDFHSFISKRIERRGVSTFLKTPECAVRIGADPVPYSGRVPSPRTP